jgi:protein-S-isoprenylcysteine O-methyltransferase Ste14
MTFGTFLVNEVISIMKFFMLAVLWIVWCALHSGMISVTATGYLKRWLGTRFRIYRLIFNLVALVTVIPVMAYGQWLRGPMLFRWEGVLILFQVILLISALLLFLAGARHYDLLQFSGLRQLKTGSSHNALTETGELDTTGVLDITRHPWYLGGILIIWTRDIDLSALVTNIILTLYFIVGCVLEERKLLIEYGDVYRRYQEKVSMLIPLKWILSATRDILFQTKVR